MRGEKTITFDFEFQYSSAGTFMPANTITVRAPSLDQYKVHSIMQGWTTEGAIGYRKAFAAEIEKAAAVGVEPAPVVADDAAMEDKQIDVMAMMAAGLPPEKYATFSQFVMDTLKNNARLAYVGGDPKAPITDHVMKQIGELGGVSDWDRVASEFASFFMLGTGSKAKSNGADSSPVSVSHTKAHSTTSRRVNTRLQS